MDKKKLAIFGSLKFGAGDYIAHLYPHLDKLFDLEILSFSHMALDDLVTPEESQLVFKNILHPRLLLRPTTYTTLAESYVKLYQFLEDFQPQVFNLQITAFIRVLHYFFYTLVSYIKTKKTKIIFTFHDVLHIGEENVVNNQVLFPLYQLADAAIVGNEMERDRLKSLFNFKQPIVIGHHGVYDLFDQGIFDKKTAREKLKIKQNEMVALFFGILRKNKGLEYLLQAFSEIKKRKTLNPIRLYVAVTLRNQFELKKYFQEMAEKLQINDCVTLNIREKNVFTLEEIEMLFKACDIVVLPYTHISQSGILNLAVGFKKPLVITDAFIEAKEIDKKLGITVPLKDETKLAEAIISLVENYQQWSKIFLQNLNAYQKKHDWQTLANEMLEIANRI